MQGGDAKARSFALKRQRASAQNRQIPLRHHNSLNICTVCTYRPDMHAMAGQAQSQGLLMRLLIFVATGVVALAGYMSSAEADTNVALSADGGSFVSASSALDPSMYGLTAVNGGQSTAHANLLTTTPTVWLNDNDSRYLFSASDTNESIVISLGASRSLQSFGATWFTSTYHDRAPGSFSVLVSMTGTTWTSEGSSLTGCGNSSESRCKLSV